MRRYDKYGLIRFFMAICIFTCHFNILMRGEWKLDDLNHLVKFCYTMGQKSGGKMPVCFFELSGFLMWSGYSEIINKGSITFNEYITKRVRRLYPLLIISIIFTTLGQWIYFYYNGEWCLGRVNDIWHVLCAMTGISVGTIINMPDAVNGPIWYISILMICYVVFWKIVKLGDGNNQKVMQYVLGIVAVGLIVLNYEIDLPFLTSYTSIGYIGFFLGVYLSYVIKESHMVSYMKRGAASVLGFLVILLVIFDYRFLTIFGEEMYSYAFILFPSIIILFETTKVGTIMNNGVCTYLGKLSFPIFLLHIPVFVWTKLFIDCYGGVLEKKTDASIFLTVMLSVIGCAVIWCLIEVFIGVCRKHRRCEN